MMLGHLPYPTFYAPGPAYNNIGPDPIQMANANPAAFTPGGVYWAAPWLLWTIALAKVLKRLSSA